MYLNSIIIYNGEIIMDESECRDLRLKRSLLGFVIGDLQLIINREYSDDSDNMSLEDDVNFFISNLKDIARRDFEEIQKFNNQNI